MINEFIYKNNISSDIYDFYRNFKKITGNIKENFDNFFLNLEKEKRFLKNEQKNFSHENEMLSKDNKECASSTDNDKEKEIENKSNLSSIINNSDKKEILESQSEITIDKFKLENKESNKESFLSYSQFSKRLENRLILNYVKENKLQFIIISKIISKVFKTKQDNESSIQKALNNQTEKNKNLQTNKTNSDYENNKNLLINKIKSSLGKQFNFYLMNSKIIDNEDQGHCSKIEFFLKEIILYFFLNFFETFKDKIDMELPREILKVIINILQEYEVQCDFVIKELQTLSEKIILHLQEGEKKRRKTLEKMILKNRISTNKKFKKSKLSKKRTRITKLKKLEKGANKLEKYFKKSSIKHEINFENLENSNICPNKKTEFLYNLSYISKDKSRPYLSKLTSSNKASDFDSVFFAESSKKIRNTKPGTYSTIFENENILNESYNSNQNSNKHSIGNTSKISVNKEIEKKEINYKNFFKNNFLRNRNYINSNNSKNNYFNSYLHCNNNSSFSICESISQPISYLYGNNSQFFQNNSNNNKFINLSNNNSISQIKSVNQSFEENCMQQRKSSNVTFGYPLSNNTNNFNNSNFLNSSFFNNTDEMANNITMSLGSNALNEKLYDQFNKDMDADSENLCRQNSTEINRINVEINKKEVEIQNFESNMLILANLKAQKPENFILSPQNINSCNFNENLSKTSSGELSLKLKKQNNNFNSFSQPYISSTKSTNHSVFTNSNNSQNSITHLRSNQNNNHNCFGNFNLNSNSNLELSNKDNMASSVKKITLSFADNDSSFLNSSLGNENQSIYDSENKKSLKSYGLNTLLHNRIDNLPKMKKAKTGSSQKKKSKNKANKFINMIFNKLNDSEKELKKNVILEEGINKDMTPEKHKIKENFKKDQASEQYLIYSELDAKSDYQLREKSKSNGGYNKSNSYSNSKKAKSSNNILTSSSYNNKDMPKKSPENLKGSDNYYNSSGKKYINREITFFLSAEKIKTNSKKVNCNNEIVEDSSNLQDVTEVYNDNNNLHSNDLLNIDNDVLLNNFKTKNKEEINKLTINSKIGPINKTNSSDLGIYESVNQDQKMKKELLEIVITHPEIKEITKSNLSESIKKVKNKKLIDNPTAASNISKMNLNTADSYTTKASESNSIIKTRSSNLKAQENKEMETLLNKKRKPRRLNEKMIENKKNLLINCNKNANNPGKIKSYNHKKENYLNESKIEIQKVKLRKTSVASNTDDEILVYQTPDKRQDLKVTKHSPNTVSRKNLMELFAQMKKF